MHPYQTMQDQNLTEVEGSSRKHYDDDLDRLIFENPSAEFLGVSARTLQAWRYRGGGPKYVRISSRAIRYRKRDLIEFAEARLCTSTSRKWG